MEQLQGSLCSDLEGHQKILKNFKDRRLCSARTHCTRKCGIFTKIHQDHTLAMANLEMATKDDRTLVALLTKTTSELSSQVAHLTTKLATSQAENARIKKSGHQSTTAGHRHWSSRNLTLSDPKLKPRPKCVL